MTNEMFNLQLFAEGEGAASSVGEGAASPGVESQSPADAIKGLPEHVREKVYGKSAKTKSAPVTEVKAEAKTESAPVAKKPTYEELINSDEYKEEHRKHVKKAVDDRWKKYNGIETKLNAANEALEFAAFKYGLDPNGENFLADLKKAMEADDTFVQDYADKHDMSTEEARRVMSMQRRMEKLERAEETARREAQAREFTQKLVTAGEKTKARFPEFDLDTCMQNPAFVRLVQATNGNTTAAYMACYGEDVLNRTAQVAEARATEAVSASVKSNASRPVENGVGGNATAVTQVDTKNMTLADFRKIRDDFKRTGVRPKF
jgi:hypothetical protein